MSSRKPPNLERSLADLEALVEELESGELPLEIAMQKFEEGIRLTRGCQAALREAEQRVQILLHSTGDEDVLEEFIGGEDIAPLGNEGLEDEDDDGDDDDDDRA